MKKVRIIDNCHIIGLSTFVVVYVIFLSLGNKTEDNNQDVLYVAMAGTHQIWVLYLKDGTWLKGG